MTTTKPTKPMNVLWLMTDQLNANCLSFFGRQVRTPHLDALARESVVFTNAYCNNPVCGPSRISSFTGQHPHTHRILGNNIHGLDLPHPPTIATELKRAGYQNILVGKSHMVGAWDRAGFDHLHYCDLCDASKNDPFEVEYIRYLRDHDLLDQHDLACIPPGRPGADLRGFVSEIPFAHTVETWTGDVSIQAIDALEKGRPFFLYTSFQRPHEPYSIPRDAELKYNPDEIELPPSSADLFQNQFRRHHPHMERYADRSGGYPFRPADESELRRQLAFYYSLVGSIDEQIGRIIAHLKAKDLYDNTIIVFASDHGDFAGEHGLMLKNLGIFESINRIPLFIRIPGRPAKIVEGEIVESIDLFPTILAALGRPSPPTVEGVDLSPIGEGKAKGKSCSLCEWSFDPDIYPEKVVSIRTRDFRMVYFGKKEGGELYDLTRDPLEMANVYYEKAYQSVRNTLHEILFSHVNSYATAADFRRDHEYREKDRHCLTSLLHKRGIKWSQIADLKPLVR